MTLPQPPPVLKSFVQQLTSVQSLINFAPTTQVHLMASTTRLPTSPISSEGSTVLLSSDRDLLPGLPDHRGILQRSQINLGLQIILVRPDRHRSSRDRQIDYQPGLCIQPETCRPIARSLGECSNGPRSSRVLRPSRPGRIANDPPRCVYDRHNFHWRISWRDHPGSEHRS